MTTTFQPICPRDRTMLRYVRAWYNGITEWDCSWCCLSYWFDRNHIDVTKNYK